MHIAIQVFTGQDVTPHLGLTVFVIPQVLRQSRLYESAPAYLTDQPRFVNGALAALTSLQPLELLDALKSVEVTFKRDPVPLLKLMFFSAADLQQALTKRLLAVLPTQRDECTTEGGVG